MDKIETLDRLMRDQIAFIDAAIVRVRANQLMDVADLNKAVDDICRDIQSLDDDQKQRIESRTAEMIVRLEELAEELKNLQDRVDNAGH